MDKVALEQTPPPRTSVFPFQHHATEALRLSNITPLVNILHI
jgi:hypothetical protein